MNFIPLPWALTLAWQLQLYTLLTFVFAYSPSFEAHCGRD